MLAVPEALETWLSQCPTGPIPVADEHVKVAVKALAEGWSSTLMRALALGPCSLTELSGLIPEVSYPSLERRIRWMRASGQIAALPKGARGTPYAPTDWLRRSVAPLSVAGRCERRFLERTPPITDVEIEAAFLLTLPLVRLPEAGTGTCLLASRNDRGDEAGNPALAGATVEVRGGEVTACSVEWEGEPPTWAIGTSDAWLDAVIDGHMEDLRIGGTDPQLACDLAQALNLALFTDR
jgi:hypothetical protein